MLIAYDESSHRDLAFWQASLRCEVTQTTACYCTFAIDCMGSTPTTFNTIR